MTPALTPGAVRLNSSAVHVDPCRGNCLGNLVPAGLISAGPGAAQRGRQRPAACAGGGRRLWAAWYDPRHHPTMRSDARSDAPSMRVAWAWPVRAVHTNTSCSQRVFAGLALAAAGCNVTLTEHPTALANLQHNVGRADNQAAVAAAGGAAVTAELQWGEPVDRAAVAAAGRFDLIVGTDVVFAVRWVRPLLKTLHRCVTSTGAVWLCLQVRACSCSLSCRPAEFYSVPLIVCGPGTLCRRSPALTGCRPDFFPDDRTSACILLAGPPTTVHAKFHSNCLNVAPCSPHGSATSVGACIRGRA